jgi:hypothetical protein
MERSFLSQLAEFIAYIDADGMHPVPVEFPDFSLKLFSKGLRALPSKRQILLSLNNDEWTDICYDHLSAIHHYFNRNNIFEAYKSMLACTLQVIRLFDRRSLGALFHSLNSLRLFAIQYDRINATQLASSSNLSIHGKSNDDAMDVDTVHSGGLKLEEAARTIMRAFNFCLNDRAGLETSRKWATYYVLSLLFKTYKKALIE